MKLLRQSKVSLCAVLAALGAVGCGDGWDADSAPAEPSLAGEDSALLLEGERFPNRAVPMCWTAASRAYPDFTAISTRAHGVAWRQWVQATGLSFLTQANGFITGWGSCPANTDGWITWNLTSKGGSYVDLPIGYDPEDDTELVIDVPHEGADKVFAHELGHALGFAHEQYRADFDPTGQHPDYGSCTPGGSEADTLETPPDVKSLLASSYCQNQGVMSYWDTIGAQNAYGHPNRFADINGDGRAEVIVVDPNTPRISWLESNGSSFSTSRRTGMGPGTKGTFFVDVTGDAKADLLRIDDEGTWVRPSESTKFGALTSWAGAGWYGEWANFFADVTGDGKADFVAIDKTRILVRKSNGSGFATAGTWLNQGLIGRWGTWVVDVTGDKAADLVVLVEGGFQVWKSNKTSGFSSGVFWGSNLDFGTRGGELADVDGDGDADLVALNENEVLVYRSNGSTFVTPPERWSTIGAFGDRGTFLVDVNNDKRADLVSVRTPLIEVRLSNGSRFNTSSVWYNGAFWSNQIPVR